MMTTKKIDLYQRHKADYAAPRIPVLILIRKATYLAIDGRGAPGGPAFADAVGALYGVAFTIAMTRKFAKLQAYAVCKLEGLWWTEDEADFLRVARDDWRWTLMIRTPEFVKETERRAAVATLLKRGKDARVADVRLQSLTEGRSVQMLHVGPYDKEPVSIAAMHAFAASHGLAPTGAHHEIYLSDPRRVAPAKLKTILRLPVRSA
jgi:hypothetical protein